VILLIIGVSGLVLGLIFVCLNWTEAAVIFAIAGVAALTYLIFNNLTSDEDLSGCADDTIRVRGENC
jgi:hypothetical protein